jgi:hypothetical protein
MFHTLLKDYPVDVTIAVRNVEIGTGQGPSIDLARRAAATRGLQYLHAHGIPRG